MKSYTFDNPIFHHGCHQCGALATGWANHEQVFYNLPCGCASNETFHSGEQLAPELIALAILQADEGNTVTADIYGMSMVRIHMGNT